jgi:hypothetical protein
MAARVRSSASSMSSASGSAWEGVRCKRHERRLTREEFICEIAEAQEPVPYRGAVYRVVFTAVHNWR